MQNLVISFFAHDKPGQVERLAQCIVGHGGNWLESRMAHMAGQFAGILRVGAPAERHDELLSALQALKDHGIQVMFTGTDMPIGESGKTITLELVGNDRPGIVRDITRLLAELGVNVERMVTDVRPAPMSNELLFSAEAVLAVPQGVPLTALQERLETLADELMVDLTFGEHAQAQ